MIFCLHIWQGQLLITEHVLSLPLLCEDSRRPYLISSSGCPVDLNFPFCVWASHACGFSDSLMCAAFPYTYICTTSGYRLLLICFMSIWLLDQRKGLGVWRHVSSSYIDLIPLNMKDYWVQFAPVSVGEQRASPKDGKLKDKRSPNSCLPWINFH